MGRLRLGPAATAAGQGSAGGLQQRLSAFAVWSYTTHSAALGISYHNYKMNCLVTLPLEFFLRPKLHAWKRSLNFS